MFPLDDSDEEALAFARYAAVAPACECCYFGLVGSESVVQMQVTSERVCCLLVEQTLEAMLMQVCSARQNYPSLLFVCYHVGRQQKVEAMAIPLQKQARKVYPCSQSISKYLALHFVYHTRNVLPNGSYRHKDQYLYQWTW